MRRDFIIYEDLAGPINFTVPAFPTWFLWLAEPVRVRRDRRAAIALIVSGMAPISPTALTIPPPPEVTAMESKWHQPWSEPRRYKAGIRYLFNQPGNFFFQPIDGLRMVATEAGDTMSFTVSVNTTLSGAYVSITELDVISVYANAGISEGIS